MSLQAALGDLRDAPEVTSKKFWIDQICINQEGNEKSKQVALMGQIYRNALRVITYAGPSIAAGEERRGLSLVRLLGDRFSVLLEPMYQAHSPEAARRVVSQLPEIHLPRELINGQNGTDSHDDIYVLQGWRWLLRIAFGKWTQRLWILQEQLLNKEIWMLHGSSLISWDLVAIVPLLFTWELLPRRFLRRFWQDHLSPPGQSPEDISTSAYALWYQRQGRKRGQPSAVRTLIKNMAMHESLECWDPRDRIFALLAISSDATDLDITPDYSETATTNRVFHDASIRILQRYPRLAPLVFACRWADWQKLSEHDTSPPALTTANPSWALGPLNHPVPAFSEFDEATPHPRTSLSSAPRFRLAYTILVLKGSVADSIFMSSSVTFLAHSATLGVIDDQWIQSFSQIIIGWADVLSYVGTTLENAGRLCRAIVASLTWSPLRQGTLTKNETFAFHFWCLYRNYTNIIRNRGSELYIDVSETIEQCDGLLYKLAAQSETFRSLVGIDDAFDPGAPLKPKEKSAFEEVSYPLIHGRSFCVTDAGRICNAMNQPQPGDKVAAFQGSDRLWVLRPVGNRYRLVGDAFVVDLMKGQAYHGLDADETDYDIELI